MFDIDELIEACRAAAAETSPRQAVKEVLKRAVSRPGDVAEALPVTTAGIVPLYAAPELSVVHVVWAPGMKIRPHDHLMWAAIGLYAGREDNTFYRRLDRGMERSGARQLETKDVDLLGDDVIHAVANPLRTYTGAIHVYGGDITTQPGRIEWDEDAKAEVPFDFARARRYFEEANAAVAMA